MNHKSAKDAYEIQQGPCNPKAIARAIVAAIDEMAETEGSRAAGKSPAVRQMVHQLAFILRWGDPYDGPMFHGEEWSADYHACEAMAKPPAETAKIEAAA